MGSLFLLMLLQLLWAFFVSPTEIVSLSSIKNVDSCSQNSILYVVSANQVKFNPEDLKVLSRDKAKDEKNLIYDEGDLNVVYTYTFFNEFDTILNISEIETGRCASFLHDQITPLSLGIEFGETRALRFLFQPLIDSFVVKITFVAANHSIVQYKLQNLPNPTIEISTTDNALFSSITKSTLLVPEDEESFQFIAASDSQPYRHDECADPNWDRKCYEDKLSDFRYQQFSPINFINGDLTEFGRVVTYNVGDSIFKYNHPAVVLGLGNHDYENNVNDCTEKPDYSQNACARNAVRRLWRKVKGSTRWRTSNFSFDATENPLTPSGSFAYSFDLGKHFHVIQANNRPDYEVRLFHYAHDNINVYPSFDLIKKIIERVTKQDRIVLLNYHNCFYDINKLKQLYEAANKKLVAFYGHSHTLGMQQYEGGLMGYNSGALFHKEYLVVRAENRTLSVYSFNYKDGLKFMNKQTFK